jgi:hypothetical protein
MKIMVFIQSCVLWQIVINISEELAASIFSPLREPQIPK